MTLHLNDFNGCNLFLPVIIIIMIIIGETKSNKSNQTLVFEETGKPEFPEKNLSEQSREPKNSAHIRRRVRESNPRHIGGRRALSPLSGLVQKYF